MRIIPVVFLGKGGGGLQDGIPFRGGKFPQLGGRPPSLSSRPRGPDVQSTLSPGDAWQSEIYANFIASYHSYSTWMSAFKVFPAS